MLKGWTWASLPLLAIGALLAVVPHFWFQARAFVFLGVLALFAAELAIIGKLIQGRFAGAFIDNRNRLSLSKLQAGAWTVIVLSALATAAAFNLVHGENGATVTALDVVIPPDLLLAMGISATSLVATPALLSLKAAQQPQAGAGDDAAARLNLAGGIGSNGKLLTLNDPSDASWADLVTGDELGNAGTPDLGKIQQAFITLILLACYADYVFVSFASANLPTIGTLPGVDQSFVWLMGISHASYLAYKAAPHTQSAS